MQPAEVVAWLGAIQAQDYAGAKWSIGLRLPNTTDAQVEQAVANRSIVRTWLMRGTLHIVAAKDIRWTLSLIASRNIGASALRARQFDLDDAIFGRCRDLFAKALEGGKQLTRDEMYALMEQAGIATGGQRGYHILWRLAQEGLICLSAEQTFALLDEWIPAPKPMDRDGALAELVKRYFFSHGPATLADFARWTGLTLADGKAGLAAVGAQLVHEGGYWMSPDLDVSARGVYLLPGFDELILGYKDRTASLDAKYEPQICPGGNGVFQPTIVVDGKVVGTWKRAIKKGRLVVTANPFKTLSKAKLKTPAKHYGRYMNMPCEVE